MIAFKIYEGTVKLYSQEKGFGFIGSKSRKLCNDAWFHITDVRGENPPKTGDKLTFSISEEMKKERYTALEILIKGKPPRHKIPNLSKDSHVFVEVT